MAAAAAGGESSPPPLFLLSYGRRRKRRVSSSSTLGHSKTTPRRRRRKSLTSLQHSKIELLYGIDEDCYTRLMPPGYEWKYKLGEGDYGIAVLACRADRSAKISQDSIPACVVIKLQHIDSVANFNYETELHHKFFEVGLAPRLYNVHHWRRCTDNKLVGGMVMDRISGTLEDMLELAQPQEVLDHILWWIVDTIDLMCEYNLAHADMHLSNIGYIFNPKTNSIRPTLIDFGFASDHGCDPQLELLQPLRTLNKELYATKIDKGNERYLFDHLFDIYRKVWAPGIPKTQDALEEEFLMLRDKHNKVLDKQVQKHARRRRSLSTKRSN